MSPAILSSDALARALAVRDLTDPTQGPHAMQRLVEAAPAALAAAWGCQVILHRADPVVSVADNYDRLGTPPGAAAREARYTRYVASDRLLRTQTSAMVPPLVRSLAPRPPQDALLACPGLVWRRDVVDRLHVGEPHQLDLWRLRSGPPLAVADLEEMIRVVCGALLLGREARASRAVHPYTRCGRQIDVRAGDAWVEVGECGLAAPDLLAREGMPPAVSGLAMGLGLDRILMLRKGLDDIRLLRSRDPRVAAQMLDLEPWRPVSRQPPLRRDLSLAVDAGTTAEELGDRVREALGERASSVESVELVSATPAEALPPGARLRLGIRPGQENALLRLVIRDLDRTLTSAEANEIRDRVYAALHRGDAWEWAGVRRGTAP